MDWILRSGVLIGFIIISLLMNGLFPAFVKNGFFCNDATISYPFEKDTIDPWRLLLAAFIIPIGIIMICEYKLKTLLNEFTISHKAEAAKIPEAPTEPIQTDASSDQPECASGSLTERHSTINNSGNSGDTAEKVEGDIFSAKSGASLDDDSRLKRGFVDIISDEFLRNGAIEIRLFCFGIAVTMFFTGICKLASGRLRPHFMQRCKPDVNCLSPDNLHRYITSFSCADTSLGYFDMIYITTSWPSGHASAIFYSSIYLGFYLDMVVPIIRWLDACQRSLYSPLALFSFQVTLVSLAAYISITRVTDNHHHASDVLSGAIVGFLVAFASFRSFPRPSRTRLLNLIATHE